jgi:hypothetical protein
VDAAARETGDAKADGEIVWSRHPDAGVKLAAQERGRRWQKSPVAEESTYKPKTIARGMPGDSGVT